MITFLFRIIVILFLNLNLVYSQDIFFETINQDSIYTEVDQKAEVEGGEKALAEYVLSKLRYPAMARENNTQGTVIISFIVNIDGSFEDIKVEKGIGDGCDEEALKAVKRIPIWKPALIKNKLVRSRVSLPIQFKLQ